MLFHNADSAFYSPLIATFAGGFLENEGYTYSFGVLPPGKLPYELFRDGHANIMQSAVSANWKPAEQGVEGLPVHFALINRFDGFFLASRNRDEKFCWTNLEQRTVLADHGAQPLSMLKYAAHVNNVDWTRINLIDRGTPEQMIEAFRRGEGDYIHLQGRTLSYSMSLPFMYDVYSARSSTSRGRGISLDSSVCWRFHACNCIQHCLLLPGVF
jgi:NitT/TauT family transport system substrate-binding protein